MIEQPKTLADEDLDKRAELALAVLVNAIQKIEALGLVPKMRPPSGNAYIITVDGAEVGLPPRRTGRWSTRTTTPTEALAA